MSLPNRIEIDNGITLIKIPKGVGVRGVNGFFQKADSKPQVKIHIQHDFYLSETAITSSQWKKMGMKDLSRFPTSITPVETVSRRLALQYIDRLNKNYPELDEIKGTFRLPTESEWEYSARAGDTSKRPRSDYVIGGVANSPKGGGAEFGSLEDYISRGAKPREAALSSTNSWGLKGMIGCVAEHCADPYVVGNRGVPNDGSVRKGPGKFINGVEHWAQRGGSFDINPSDLNYYWKAGIDMNEADARDGIRVAWSPD